MRLSYVRMDEREFHIGVEYVETEDVEARRNEVPPKLEPQPPGSARNQDPSQAATPSSARSRAISWKQFQLDPRPIPGPECRLDEQLYRLSRTIR